VWCVLSSFSLCFALITHVLSLEVGGLGESECGSCVAFLFLFLSTNDRTFSFSFLFLNINEFKSFESNELNELIKIFN